MKIVVGEPVAPRKRGQELGVSPARFIEQRRIERAQALLESSSLPVYAIAEATGFSSQFYFSARFKAVTGTNPSAWRQQATRLA